MEYGDDGDANCNWYTWNDPQRIVKETGRLGNKIVGNPNYSIIMIGLNTEKSPGDLRRLVVTQTPEKDHQPTMEWKSLNDNYDNRVTSLSSDVNTK